MLPKLAAQPAACRSTAWHGAPGLPAGSQTLPVSTGQVSRKPWGGLVKDLISPSLCSQQPSILQAQKSQWTKINCFSTTCAQTKPTFLCPEGVKRWHSILFPSVAMSFNSVTQPELELKDDQMEVVFVFNF